MHGADDEEAATCGSLKTAEDSGNAIALWEEGGHGPSSRRWAPPLAVAPCYRPRCTGRRRELSQSTGKSEETVHSQKTRNETAHGEHIRANSGHDVASNER